MLGGGQRTTQAEDLEAVAGGLGGGEADLDAALAASLAAEDQLQAQEVDTVLAAQLAAELDEREALEAAQRAAAKERDEKSVLTRMSKQFDKGLDSVAGGFSSVGSWLRTPRPSDVFRPGAAAAAAAAAASSATAATATGGPPAAPEPNLWDLPSATPSGGAGGGAWDPSFAPLVRPPSQQRAADSMSACVEPPGLPSAPPSAPFAPPRAAPAPPAAQPTVNVPELLRMGFSWAQVHHALETTGDLHLAREMLLEQRTQHLAQTGLRVDGPD